MATETQETYVSRRLELATYLIEHPEELRMSGFGHQTPGCRTRACIAGWAVLLSGEARWWDVYDDNGDVTYRTLQAPGDYNISSFAIEYLGLPEQDARRLFFSGYGMSADEKAAELLQAEYVNSDHSTKERTDDNTL